MAKSKKNHKKRNPNKPPMTKEEKRLAKAKKGKERRIRARAEDEKRYEREEFPAVGPRQHAVCLLALALISVAWVLSSRVMFVATGLVAMIQLASFYFACIVWLYVVRCAVESKRRYGVLTLKSMWYYSQTAIYAVKRSVSVFIVIFAVLLVMRWMIPSPTLSTRAVSCMDIAGAYYLSYIHSTYYGKEQIPYKYMETVFLMLTFITPYLVYFMG